MTEAPARGGLPALLGDPLAGFLHPLLDAGLGEQFGGEGRVEGLGLRLVFLGIRATEDDALGVAVEEHRDLGVDFGGGHFSLGFHIGFWVWEGRCFDMTTL